MNEGIDNYLDVMTIIIVLVCSLMGMSLLTGYWSTSIVANRQDKTSLDTLGKRQAKTFFFHLLLLTKAYLTHVQQNMGVWS